MSWEKRDQWLWVCDRHGCGETIDPGSPRRRLWLVEFNAVANEAAHWCPSCAEDRRG